MEWALPELSPDWIDEDDSPGMFFRWGHDRELGSVLIMKSPPGWDHIGPETAISVKGLQEAGWIVNRRTHAFRGVRW